MSVLIPSSFLPLALQGNPPESFQTVVGRFERRLRADPSFLQFLREHQTSIRNMFEDCVAFVGHLRSLPSGEGSRDFRGIDVKIEKTQNDTFSSTGSLGRLDNASLDALQALCIERILGLFAYKGSEEWCYIAGLGALSFETSGSSGVGASICVRYSDGRGVTFHRFR